MKEKTPDQIRRETTPVRHTGLIYGFLGGLIGAVVWFGGWGLLHQEQVRRYPDYCTHAIRVQAPSTIASSAAEARAGMSAEQLRYALLRYGNLDHRLRCRDHPPRLVSQGSEPEAVGVRKRRRKPVYSDSPAWCSNGRSL